jgi:hypothetical protein
MTSPDIAAASRPLPGWRVEFGRNWPIVLGCLLAILYDVSKSYNVALLGGAGLFFTGSMLLLTLPRFSHTPLPT